MFTGIVVGIGRVAALEPFGGDLRLLIDAAGLPLDDVGIGGSIAISGCCLTVVAHDDPNLAFDVSAETLACTTLGTLRVGDPVNMELALRLADRLDGHLVSGHVDGVGTVQAVTGDARSRRFAIGAPAALARFIAAKGSIAVDGVSLTVNRIDNTVFEINLIPHTLARTTFGTMAMGSKVNIEVDLIARYAERLLHGACRTL